MLKALILWLFSATVALGGIAFGFHKWVTHEVRQTRISRLELMEKQISNQQVEINKLIQNIERQTEIKATLGLNRSGVPVLKNQSGKVKAPEKELLKAIGRFLPEHIENSSYGVYLEYMVLNELSRSYIVVVRGATDSEKVKIPDAEFVAYFVPRPLLKVTMDLGKTQFIEDSGNSTFSLSMPQNKYLTQLRKSNNENFNLGNDRMGGDLLIRKLMPGVNMEFIAHTNYEGWEPRLRKMLAMKNWQVLIAGVAVGLLALLAGLLYHADGIGILEKKVSEFEIRFGSELKKILHQQLTKERAEAHRDISEGVYSVLKSPIKAIRSDINMFLVGVTEEQLSKKSEDINKQLDRIEKFIESLRQSNNPGQISQARCNPKAVLQELLPEWEIKVKKYGARLNQTIHEVGEVGLPERDIKAIFKNILQFEAERVAQNMYEKNINVRMEQDQQGLHFSIIDNMKIESEDLSAYKEHMALAIAIGTLEQNYCSLEMELIPEGGLRLSFDLKSQEDQNLDSLTMLSMNLGSTD